MSIEPTIKSDIVPTISPAVSGSATKITPTDFHFQVDASDSPKTLRDGTHLKIWNDLSSNRYNLRQDTPHNQPLIITRGINWRPGVRFIGGGDPELLRNTNFGISNDLTFFIAIEILTTPTGSIRRIFDFGDQFVSADWYQVRFELGKLRFVAPTGDIAIESDNTLSPGQYIIAGRYSVAQNNHSMWINRVKQTSVGGATYAGSFSDTIVLRDAFGGDYLFGNITMYDEYMNDAEIESKIDELALKVGFTPAMIPDLKVWLDGTDDRAVVESGGNVTDWLDKTGNGFDFDQPASAQQPDRGTNEIDFSIASFPYLTLGSNYLYFSGVGVSILGLVKTTQDESPGAWVYDFGELGNDGYGLSYRRDQIFGYTSTAHGGQGTAPTVSIDSEYHSVSFVIDFGTIQKLYLDNVEIGSQAITLTQLTAAEINENPIRSIGAGPPVIGIQSKADAVRNFTGQARSMVFYDRDITSDERSRLQDYFNLLKTL